jgi:hypothetical protein
MAAGCLLNVSPFHTPVNFECSCLVSGVTCLALSPRAARRHILPQSLRRRSVRCSVSHILCSCSKETARSTNSSTLWYGPRCMSSSIRFSRSGHSRNVHGPSLLPAIVTGDASRIAHRRSFSVFHLGQETITMREPSAKILGDRLAHIRKRRARAQTHSRASTRRVCKDGDVLA